MNIARRLLLPAALAIGVLASGCVVAPYGYSQGYYSDGVVAPQAPPPPRDEAVGSPAVSGQVWVDGYWNWSVNSYVWVPGVWVAPRVGYYWQPYTWIRRGPSWYRHGGRWIRR